MAPSRRRKLIALAVSAVLFVPSYIYSFRAPSNPTDCTFHIDLTRARQLATSLPGDRPSEIRVERLNSFWFPGAVVSTGQPWSFVELPTYSFQLRAGDQTILIDPGLTASQSRWYTGVSYDDAAWTRVARAMAAAKAIYVTHEHVDHLGGLLAAGPLEKAHLTTEQLAAANHLFNWLPNEQQRRALTPLSYDDQLAIAPGVVLIKAPGHTTGSQLVYVLRNDGREVLLLGDGAWRAMQIEQGQGQPRAQAALMSIDRHAVTCQLRDFKQLDPKVTLVPGHDPDVIARLTAAGLLAARFE